MPKISVIMAVYNAEKYIYEAVQSVLNQSLTDLELICVDDGSIDESLNILHDIAAKDKRVMVLTHSNRGASYTRNRALDAASGEYIHILDGDDMIAPCAYEDAIQIAAKEDLDMLLFDAQALFEDDLLEAGFPQYRTYYLREKEYGDVEPGIVLFSKLSADGVYRSQASMYILKKDFLDRHEIRFYEGITHEDQLFTFLCIMEAERASHKKEQYFIRRVRDHSTMTQSVSYKNVEGLLVCYVEMLDYLKQNNSKSIGFEEAILKEASAIARSGIKKYSLLSPEECEKAEKSNLPVKLIIDSFGKPYRKIAIDKEKLVIQQKQSVLRRCARSVKRHLKKGWGKGR